MEAQEEVSTVNDLIETLKDGEEGFKQAAEGVKNAELKMLFGSYSHQRMRFARELETKAKQLGESEPEQSSSTAGVLHRAWINLKSALTSSDDYAVLAECECGEDSAVAEYKKALASSPEAPLREVIARQYSEVKAAHDRVRTLRDAAKKN